MKTIAKNSKAAARVFASAKSCRSYSLSNSFVGQECDPQYARQALENNLHARLRETSRAGATHVVSVHSNQWYELTVPAEEEGKKERDYAVYCEEGPDATPVDSLTVRASSEREAIRIARARWGVTADEARRAKLHYRAAPVE